MTDEKTPDRTQCAGQHCEQRSTCIRFVSRGRADWASFDLERRRFPGVPCPHFVFCRTRPE